MKNKILTTSAVLLVLSIVVVGLLIISLPEEIKEQPQFSYKTFTVKPVYDDFPDPDVDPYGVRPRNIHNHVNVEMPKIKVSID